MTGQINQVREKIESLTDALIDRLIDKETFNDRNEKLTLEQARLEEEKAKAERSVPDPGHVCRFLELVKNLAETYGLGNRAEKREIVEIATSNRRVSGKFVYLEPANWLVQVESAIAGLCGAPARTTSRTRLQLRDRQVEGLIALSNLQEMLEIPESLKTAIDCIEDSEAAQ